MIDKKKLKEYTTKVMSGYAEKTDRDIPMDTEHLSLVEHAMYDIARQMSVTYANKKRHAKTKLEQEKRMMGWIN